MSTTEALPEREATPDEAYELGAGAGYDEGYAEAERLERYRVDVALGLALRVLSDDAGARFLEAWHLHYDEHERENVGDPDGA